LYALCKHCHPDTATGTCPGSTGKEREEGYRLLSDGYQTVLSINPDLDLQIIVLSNGGNDTKEQMWDLVELTTNHFK